MGGGCKCTRSHVSRLGMPRRRAVPPRSPNSAISLVRGCGVSARAHACVALAGPGGLGRCVAFGRPMMSVWGHAASRVHGAGRPKGPKSHAFHSSDPFFGTLFSITVFCFSCDSPAPVILRTLLTLMDLSTGEPRAPLRAHGHAPSPEATSHQPPTTYPPHPPSAWLDATKWPSLRPWIRNSMLHRLKGRLCSPRSTQIHNY